MPKKSISTKKGDSGSTSLRMNKHVLKHDIRPESIGTIDEAAAFIGLARAKSRLHTVQKALWMIQNHIFLINAEIACPAEYRNNLKTTLKPDHLKQLEQLESDIESEIELPAKFVLYGQSEVSAFLDTARALVRRAERRLVELNEIDAFDNELILPYFNRLSDVLFLLARYEEIVNDIPLAHPDLPEAQ